MDDDLNRLSIQDYDAIKRGVEYWNKYVAINREKNPDWFPKLRAANLNGISLPGADLDGAKLIGAELNRAGLQEATFNGADLSKASFLGADLEGAVLNDAIARETDFTGSILNHADTAAAKLYDAILDETELRGVNLWQAKLRGASMKRARLDTDVKNLEAIAYRQQAEVLVEIGPNLWISGKEYLDGVHSQEGSNNVSPTESGEATDPEATPGIDGQFEIEGQAHLDAFKTRLRDLIDSESKAFQDAREPAQNAINDALEEAKRQIAILQEARTEVETSAQELIGRMEAAKQNSVDLQTATNAAAEATKHGADIVSRLERTKSDIESTIETCREHASEALKKDTEPMLKAAKQEVLEVEILRTAQDAWKEKYDAHWNSFKWGGSIFITLIVALLFIGGWNSASIATFVKDLASQSSVFGTLAVVTVPVAGIAWVLRLISRFTLQNLNLAHDAQQRRVTIETYANLVGTASAIAQEKDRAIMLAAIFRPLPGSHSPDVAPPSLLDLIGNVDKAAKP